MKRLARVVIEEQPDSLRADMIAVGICACVLIVAFLLASAGVR